MGGCVRVILYVLSHPSQSRDCTHIHKMGNCTHIPKMGDCTHIPKWETAPTHPKWETALAYSKWGNCTQGKPGWLSGFFPCISPLWTPVHIPPRTRALHVDWGFSPCEGFPIVGIFLPHLGCGPWLHGSYRLNGLPLLAGDPGTKILTK